MVVRVELGVALGGRAHAGLQGLGGVLEGLRLFLVGAQGSSPSRPAGHGRYGTEQPLRAGYVRLRTHATRSGGAGRAGRPAPETTVVRGRTPPGPEAAAVRTAHRSPPAGSPRRAARGITPAYAGAVSWAPSTCLSVCSFARLARLSDSLVLVPLCGAFLRRERHGRAPARPHAPSRAALFLVVTVHPGAEAAVRDALQDVTGLARSVAFRAPADGLTCVVYARTPAVTERMLRSMFLGDPPGNTDRILDFSRAVTGGLKGA
ncbi:hypothetical protein [Streptomyces cinereoruber]|uniref:hypothetical protein n=1 Tax=Streptomyces cinereoruber TaxID=67260 RepID=UPI00362AD9B1